MSIQCSPGQERQQPLLPAFTEECLCVLGCVFVKSGLIARVRGRDNLLEVQKTKWDPHHANALGVYSGSEGQSTFLLWVHGQALDSPVSDKETSNERRFSPR